MIIYAVVVIKQICSLYFSLSRKNYLMTVYLYFPFLYESMFKHAVLGYLSRAVG